jgi:thiol-disulfide isomerase/thioredoxin
MFNQVNGQFGLVFDSFISKLYDKKMSLSRILILICGFGFFFSSCVEPNISYKKLPPGIWRGVLYLDETPLPTDKDEVSKKSDFTGELPFNFEVKYSDESTFYIELINDTERIKVDDIKFINADNGKKDSLSIEFKEFDTRIEAKHEEGVIEGYWIVNYKENYKIRFKAKYGLDYLFEPNNKPITVDYTGRWKILFEPDTENEYPGVADIKQNGNAITGTIETETGDYRYLEGNVYGEKALMSVFDGSHAFLIELKILKDGELTGQFRSSKHYTAPMTGIKSDTASLKNGYQLSASTSSKPIALAYPNHEDKVISINDNQYKNKVKIIEIMGTWCPNCKDATNYLKTLKSNPSFNDVEIISLAYERYRDSIKSKNMLSVYKSKLNLQWEVLLGGYYDKKEASAKIGFLDKIMAYPTLVIVGKDNVVKQVFTGFYGPATRDHRQFIQDFESKIKAEL